MNLYKMSTLFYSPVLICILTSDVIRMVNKAWRNNQNGNQETIAKRIGFCGNQTKSWLNATGSKIVIPKKTISKAKIIQTAVKGTNTIYRIFWTISSIGKTIRILDL